MRDPSEVRPIETPALATSRIVARLAVRKRGPRLHQTVGIDCVRRLDLESYGGKAASQPGHQVDVVVVRHGREDLESAARCDQRVQAQGQLARATDLGLVEA